MGFKMPSPQPQALGEGSAGAQVGPVKVSPGILAGTTREGTFEESLKLTVANCATGAGSPLRLRRPRREGEPREKAREQKLSFRDGEPLEPATPEAVSSLTLAAPRSTTFLILSLATMRIQITTVTGPCMQDFVSTSAPEILVWNREDVADPGITHNIEGAVFIFKTTQ